MPPFGWKPSAVTRAKMSAAKRGRKLSPEHVAKIASANRGKKYPNRSPEWRAKISASKLGKSATWNKKPKTEAHRAKIAAANIGKRHSEETKAKMSAAALGRAKTAEHAAAISRGKLGWNPSQQTRARMMAAAVARLDVHPPRQVYRGIRMRSDYEVRVARSFDRLGIQWQYEPKRFDLGDRTYAPDFYLPGENMWVEVKGYYGPISATKCSMLCEQYPDVTLAILMLPQIIELELYASQMAA
jgi:hypothetical protein